MRLKMPNLVKEYSVFEADQYSEAGKYRNLMPQLRDAGLRPLNTADIMRERLEALRNKDLNLRAFWVDSGFDTVDGIAHSYGKIKVAYDPKQLVNIKPNVDLNNGALIITPDEYKNLEGEEFSLRGLRGLGKRLHKYEVTNHPFWLALARGDKHFLREYSDAVFEELIKIRSDNRKGMSVNLRGFVQQQPSMQALSVYSVNRRRSDADSSSLDSDARLVGVHSRTAEGEGNAQNLVRMYTLQEVERAREALKKLKRVAKTELVEPLEVLVEQD